MRFRWFKKDCGPLQAKVCAPSGLVSLSVNKSVVRLSDRLDMTMAGDWYIESQSNQTNERDDATFKIIMMSLQSTIYVLIHLWKKVRFFILFTGMWDRIRMRGSREFFQRGSNFENVVFCDFSGDPGQYC